MAILAESYAIIQNISEGRLNAPWHNMVCMKSPGFLVALLAGIGISLEYRFAPLAVSILNNSCLTLCFVPAIFWMSRAFLKVRCRFPFNRSGSLFDSIFKSFSQFRIGPLTAC